MARKPQTLISRLRPDGDNIVAINPKSMQRAQCPSCGRKVELATQTPVKFKCDQTGELNERYCLVVPL